MFGRGGCRPDRRDAIERIAQPVEHQDQRGADKQHVRQVQRIVRRARQLFDQAIGFIAEVTDQAGQHRRQRGRNVDPAGRDQRAQLGQAVTRQRLERRAVMTPVGVDFAGRPGRPEHQVGVEAQQAVAPAHLAAFDAFQQEIAATVLDQLHRRADRGFRVGDQLPPDQRRPSVR